MRRKIASMLFAAVVFAGIVCISGCSGDVKGNLTVLDESGATIAAVKTLSDERSELADTVYQAYIEAVLSESEAVLSDLRGCTVEKARGILLKSDCVISTTFHSDVYRSIEKAYKNLNCASLAFGCAVTDLHGHMLALYSAGDGTNGFYNFATEKTPPYSSFKPLCVYAPAIENSLANWSSVFLDSPIKKIESENGKKYDWPANATGTYSEANTGIAYAIKTSLNTVAVRCMQTVGVKNSFEFLENKFGLTLDYEKKKAELHGEEEVIGNVALGYLNGGVSPADMAGYYQVFANGGMYTKPHTVLKISDKDGNVLYEYRPESRQVIKSSTAYIMNRLLQNVITAGGTGEKATIDGVAVGGKTGTGDFGNWFVGFTPEYSCAVWHGTALASNHACEVFADAVSAFPNSVNNRFPNCAGIKKAVYCSESGMLFSEKCRKADMGYYASDNIPEVCDTHN